MLITRYLSREVSINAVAVTGILMLIMLSNQLVRYLGGVADGDVAFSIVFKILTFQSPYLLSLLMPLGLFLGILLAYGRMYIDNEMTVLSSCGFSREKLVKVTFSIALVFMSIVAIIALLLAPIASGKRDQLLNASDGASIVQTILPRRFEEMGKGKRVFYVKSVSRDHDKMFDIFMSRRLRDNVKGMGPWEVSNGKQGYQIYNKQFHGKYFIAQNGYRYHGVPGQNNFEVTKFEKMGLRLHTNEVVKSLDEDAKPTWMLWLRRSHARDNAELQWRLAMPISTILLSMLAIPLARVKPRQGKFAQLLPAILIYIVYANMLFVAKAWTKKGLLPGVVGLWWVHLTLAILIVSLLYTQRVKRI